MMHIYVCMALTFKEIQNLTITNSTDSPTTTITVNFFVTDFLTTFRGRTFGQSAKYFE